MDYQCSLSDVTQRYLNRFYTILDEMIQKMTTADLTESISHNFIVQMIPHHEAAIEMSKNILKYTTMIPLQEIAKGIITEQTKSIADMKAVMDKCSRMKNSPQDIFLYKKQMQHIMQTMFSEMGDAVTTNNVSADFMREMIPHHEGAVRMSEYMLHFDICPELKPILNAIIISQKKGIREMEYLLCRQIGL